MKSMYFKLLSNQKGSALISVLIALVVIMILLTAMSTLFDSNLLQTKQQERSVQAYYLALSGIDLGVAALLKEGVGGPNDTLLYTEFSSANKPNIADTPTLTDTIVFGDGKVDISIKALDIAGERWVEIHAIGSLNHSSVTRSTNLQFLASNPAVQRRTQNTP